MPSPTKPPHIHEFSVRSVAVGLLVAVIIGASYPYVVLKFGFGRATDLVNNHIRRGRLSREDGLRLVRRHDGAYPHTYLGRPIGEILGEIGMTQAEFDKICDRFTNKRLFVCDNRGAPVRQKDGSLIKINYDNSP